MAEYTFLQKLKRYLNEEWNFLDLAGCSLFLFGFILKLIAISVNSPYLLIWTRYFTIY